MEEGDRRGGGVEQVLREHVVEVRRGEDLRAAGAPRREVFEDGAEEPGAV